MVKYNVSLSDSEEVVTPKTLEPYHERDLHRLLTTYLNRDDIQIYAKTIFHEESKRKKDDNQRWTHPDMVGVRLLPFKTEESHNFLKVIDKKETFKLYSYELKRKINNDVELKKAYFQAVSNSSWANYGYLVVFEIDKHLKEEMERLNQSFGIGVIQLVAKPAESIILFQARYKNIDFNTVDKLCNVNQDFKQFIKMLEGVLRIENQFYSSTKNEFEQFCDEPFHNDAEIKAYCKEKHIPY